MKKIFCLVDCNNFFVSCERVFNPKLNNKPVIVLSNNDGCIVARSNEVKELGIPMGMPYFKCKSIIERNKVAVFSSNYELYGDMSNRVMKTLSEFTPDIEYYSIDEAFLDLTKIMIADFDCYGTKIKKAVFKNTGIPVSIGIAQTKTLAKIATEVAKKDDILNGVLDLSSCYPKVIDKYLKRIQVEDVWGIGRKNSVKLQLLGIYTAYDLKNMNQKLAKKYLTVMGQRTVLELNNIPCVKLNDIPDPKKNIASTRSFGRPVTTVEELSQSVSFHSARVCEKLRDQKSLAYTISVFIITNRFKKENFYMNSATVTLPSATSYTPDILKAGIYCLKKIFLAGKNYKKIGVILTNIISETDYQYSALEEYNKTEAIRKNILMKTIDLINRKYGRNTVLSLTEGVKKGWKMKRNLLSKRFTTNWNELLIVKI